jgi:hypothetical protein
VISELELSATTWKVHGLHNVWLLILLHDIRLMTI